jgi:regulator of sigma E protease
MHEFLISTVAFIVLIGVMVVVHEFGHFIVAKLCGVRVEAFSFGFGPRLFGIKYGETDYKVCLLPLGGFVKMTGENPGEEENLAEDPAAFTSHPRWQRMLIGVAGPGFNFILAPRPLSGLCPARRRRRLASCPATSFAASTP